MDITRATVMEIDLKNFEYNVSQIKKKLENDVKIMPVIKANAYGTYINKVNKVLNQFYIVAVAIVDEAVELRKQGYDKEIFVLNQPYKTEIEKIVKYNISIGISSDSFLEELGKIDKQLVVHIEIGTGMGRTGINPVRTKEYIDKVKQFKNIKIEGIYTHLSSADCDFDYTNKQIEGFEKAVTVAKENLDTLKYIHASASNGILNFPRAQYNLVRPGMILYGYKSCDDMEEKINLKPVCKLKSKITYLKEVEKGISIGYSRSFITSRKTKVATIPIGYADGLKRALSNTGEVVINGKKAPIIGKICMDSFMVDVTDLENVTVGDDVYIWDNEVITVDEIAQICKTINYEIISTISDRVPRVYKE